MAYEYRVIPAPKRLKKVKGVSSPAELLAATLTDALNTEARGGWEYVRAEAITAERPGGFLRRALLVEEMVLIFRRPSSEAAARGPSLREPPRREQPAVREQPALREQPSMREEISGETAPEDRFPGAARHTAAVPERSRPLASRFARGEAPSAEPAAPRTGSSTGAPPLLRPVPRHRPDEKS